MRTIQENDIITDCFLVKEVISSKMECRLNKILTNVTNQHPHRHFMTIRIEVHFSLKLCWRTNTTSIYKMKHQEHSQKQRDRGKPPTGRQRTQRQNLVSQKGATSKICREIVSLVWRVHAFCMSFYFVHFSNNGFCFYSAFWDLPLGPDAGCEVRKLCTAQQQVWPNVCRNLWQYFVAGGQDKRNSEQGDGTGWCLYAFHLNVVFFILI